ncbi:MAG: DegT/DnrJ/EryC1/StrS family aminotransferase [Candidatus Hermodarchaeota archaeon]
MKKNADSVPFSDLRRIHKSIIQDLLNVTEELLESSQFILGKQLSEFEEKFSSYIGSKCGAGVASGADALFLALKAIGVKQGDEVITVNNTFNATVDAIIRAGASPRIIDINENDLLINLDLLKQAVSKKTKAIIPVHLYGNPVNMSLIEELRNELAPDVKIIQDAAQAHGATYNNKPLGNFGDVVCYSFYPSKNLGALGDGGFIASNDSEFINQIKVLRNCGQKQKNTHTEVGFNSRLDNLQAAYLLIKLKKLEDWNQSRRTIAFKYQESLQECNGVQIVNETQKGKNVYHLFVIRMKKREELINSFQRQNIQFGIHYPVPINLTEAYENFNFFKKSFPVSEQVAKEIISIPIFPYMKDEEVAKVVNTIKQTSRSFTDQ